MPIVNRLLRYPKKWFRYLTRGKLVTVYESAFVNAWEYESGDVYIHDRMTGDVIDIADEHEYEKFNWKVLGVQGVGNFEINNVTYWEALEFVGLRGTLIKTDYVNKFMFYKPRGLDN